MINFLKKHKYFLFVLFLYGFLLVYGFNFGSFLGVIDQRFPEMAREKKSFETLYYWADFRAFGEPQSVRMPQAAEDIYLGALSVFTSDPLTLNFLKYFVINIVYLVATYAALYSFRHYVFFERRFKFSVDYLSLALISGLSVFNLYFLQSNQIASFLQRFDYIIFCAFLWCINSIVFARRGYLALIFVLIISFGTWNLFPYWLPYLFILGVYTIFLVLIKAVALRDVIYFWVVYFGVNLPPIFALGYYIATSPLTSALDYAQEILETANKTSVLYNAFSFIGGVNWGAEWGHVKEQVFPYFNYFTTNLLGILLRFFPFALLLGVLRYKKRLSLVYILLPMFLIFCFFILSVNEPFGDLYRKGFEISTLFKAYRESHNKFYPAFIFVCLLIIWLRFIQGGIVNVDKIKLFKNKINLTGIAKVFLIAYIVLFSLVVVRYSYYSKQGFFVLPDTYQKLAGYIEDKNAMVLAIPEPAILKSYDYGHYGVSPWMNILPNPGIFIYNLLENPINDLKSSKVLADFVKKRGSGVYHKGSSDPSFDTATLFDTTIDYIIIDGHVNGLPAISADDIASIKSGLEKSADFKKVFEEGKLALYKRIYNHKPLVDIAFGSYASIDFVKESPVKYSVRIRGLQEDALLVLRQTYDPRWRLFPGSLDFSRCGSRNRCGGGEGSFFDITEIAYLVKNSFAESRHGVYDKYANQYMISKDEVVGVLPDDSYKRNDDGSVDVGFVIYYYPQSFAVGTYLVWLICVIGLFFVYFVKFFRK